MRKTIKLSDDLSLPLDIGTETLAILGRRGSGKSNTATVLMEGLIDAGQQVVLLDPKGEGWGLKAQGTAPGRNVICFGEPEGDLPLREEHGETIADFVVSSGRSVVLSLTGFDADAAMRRFVARFAERLFTLKRKPQHHGPLMLVIEEAHLFVPQRVEGAQADVVSRLQRLVRQGRSMGLGTALVDQRPASVNKDVLTQIELMICHQLTSPHDRKAVDAWIEANAEVDQAAEFRRTLPALQAGEAWVWSPAKLKIFQRVTVRRRSTFDSGSTPILGKGAAAKRPQMRAVDLDALRGQLERVVEERKANDPVELKKRLAEVQRELEKARKQQQILDAVAWYESLGNREPRLTQIGAVALIDPTGGHFSNVVGPLSSARLIERGDGRIKLTNAGRAIAAPPRAGASLQEYHDVLRQRVRKMKSSGGKTIEILNAVIDAGGAELTSEEIGKAVGIDHTGGHFSNMIGPLGTAGLIKRSGGVVSPTDVLFPKGLS